MATAEGLAGARAVEAFLLPVQRYLSRRRQGIFLAAAFFFGTLVVYYLTNHEQTYFRAFVYYADNALLQGRLDIPIAEGLRFNDWAFFNGKYYRVEPILPAVVLLPGVAVWGIALNQTMASIVIGSLNASNLQRLVGRLTEKLSARILLSLIFIFGTNYWWVVINGSTTQFTHTLAVLFVFAAVYATLVPRAPLLAGLLLGAAHLCRLPTILSLPFFVIMFSDQWLPESRAKEASLFRRVDLIPLIKLGLGVGVFVLVGMVYNYVTLKCNFGLPCSYDKYLTDDPNDQYAQTIRAGLFDLNYIPKHFPGMFAGLPIFRDQKPYVIPSWAGLSFWATTPAFVYAFYAGAKGKVARTVVTVLIILAVGGIVLSNSKADPSPGGFATLDDSSTGGIKLLPFELNLPYGLEYWPFGALILCGLYFGLHDKLTLACWTAVICIGFMLTTYAFSGGWPQFGDRFALDYYPFLFLLTVRGIGSDLKWHHVLVIGLSILINLWGVVWIFKGQTIDPNLIWADWG